MIPRDQFISFGVRFGLPAYDLKKPQTYARFEFFCTTGTYVPPHKSEDAPPKRVKPLIVARRPRV